MQPSLTPSSPRPSNPLPLGALAAGFGLFSLSAVAQTTPPASVPVTTMKPISVKAKAETDENSLRATTTSIGKGEQDLRDIPQSVTVVTEKLIEDRRVDTLKQALHQTAGVTFQAAEGGEEDIRLRGFSLATSGDIYVDSLRDPAFYDRDTFSYDRVELLRGSASMLFGRGSTGGVVNQVQKQAFLDNASAVDFTFGSASFFRFTGDFNVKTGDSSGLRINVMRNTADNWGNFIDKQGLALNSRWGIGSNDEISLSGYYLHNRNGINYGLPWLRQDGAQPTSESNPAGLMSNLDPKVYYQAASDYSAGGAAYATLGWTHRFADGGQLKTALRQGRYDRDQRASTIRFCTAPACPDFPSQPGSEAPYPVTDATPLTRGSHNKVQTMLTTYGQSDYSNSFQWFGRKNEVLTGIDLAHEQFSGYATVLPAGVTLDENTPPTTIGKPNDGSGWVDESLRMRLQQSAFDAKALGVYGQDMMQVAESWKVLAGLRYDYFRGSYQSLQTAGPNSNNPNPPPVGTVTADRGRSDGQWSKRFGVLYQPSESQSYHFSYGTSFNTSGDAYQYDELGSNTPPESSRNIELGAKLDLFDGRLSARTSAFHSTKYNERDRDSPDGTPLDHYLLSAERHAAGIDVDIAGRITSKWEVYASYAWIPVAKIDKGTPVTREQPGQRPSMTPRHSGTIWSTYQLTPQLRFGAGLNARSAQTPNRNPAGIVAPHFVTGDLLAEYTFSDAVAVKLNVLNVTNKFYADALYAGHYVQGAPRTVTMTLSTHF